MYTKLKPKKPKNDLFIFAGLHSLLGFANPEMRVLKKAAGHTANLKHSDTLTGFTRMDCLITSKNKLLTNSEIYDIRYFLTLKTYLLVAVPTYVCLYQILRRYLTFMISIFSINSP